jgi:ABC-2 type transport system permease protein
MNQALTGVWAEADNIDALGSHFRFLIIFTLLMILSGWFSYQEMLKKERRL